MCCWFDSPSIVAQLAAPLYQQLMGHVDLGEWASDGEEHDFWIGLVSEIHKINMFYQERVDDHHVRKMSLCSAAIDLISVCPRSATTGQDRKADRHVEGLFRRLCVR